MYLFITVCSIGVCYLIYESIKKNNLTPQQKELLQIANTNQITDEKIKMQFINQEITLEQAIQKQIEKIKKIKRKAKEAAERKAKEAAERKAKVKAEQEIIQKLTSANNRTYFCYSLVNTESLLYLINPETNSILESSATDLSRLYKEGWRLIDVDKTGRNAQLDAFNAVVRLEKKS